MIYALCIGLFLPLVSFLGLVATYKIISRRVASLVGCGAVFISFVCFLSILIIFTNQGMLPQNYTLFSWIPVDKINADFMLHIDALSILMTLIITGVGFLIHVYSIGYMDHEEDYTRYFAFMNFFIFSMLLLVLAGNLLLLFVGWEAVGLASYLLIGFWYYRPAAAQAATKAFVINRIGDLGLLLGLLLTFQIFGTSDISEVIKLAGQKFVIGAPLITLLTILYFVGATGKSAQLPLHTWLPDAMEGPTPVSALIHAATMVTAGVYLVVRMHPVFMLSPDTMQYVGIIGAFTALFASLCALAQTDLKRVLAYSTVSQLGLMFLACGAGAFYAAMFHLMTHAFVKALLFLSAGNVVHMMHGVTDMGKMGGLAGKFPKTHWLFLIGVLALSGVPPLATFFSKDLILEQEYLAGFEILFFIGLAASILTGFYLTRAYCLTFLGKPRVEDDNYQFAKEAPPVMLIPVSLLAILSIFGGFLGFSFGKVPWLETFLAEIGVTPAEKELSSALILSPEMLMAIGGAIIGVGSAALIYTRFIKYLGRPVPVLKKAFYIDDIYGGLFVRPLQEVSQFIANWVEPKFFDGTIRFFVRLSQGTAGFLQHFQSGQIRSYVAWMVLGSVFLIAYFVF
ncbi:MAG: NADH-quinone oxidoreductase subunit L [Parachlamydiaceae bacterium]|nr:NADH-quinone oxidoreductase subunit L [Parachlamydiaceae bacterium]